MKTLLPIAFAALTLSSAGGTAATHDNSDYLKIPAAGISEMGLPKVVSKLLETLRNEATKQYKIEDCSALSDSGRQGKVVRFGGTVAFSGKLKAYAFLEECQSSNVYARIALVADGHLVKPLIEVPARFADKIDGFPLARPLVWFESLGQSKMPPLAVREQYHNGTDNAIRAKYYSVLPGPKLAEAFTLDEQGLDWVAEKRDESRIIERRVVWKVTADARIPIGWKVFSVSKDSKVLIGRGKLKKSADGEYQPEAEPALVKDYEEFPM